MQAHGLLCRVGHRKNLNSPKQVAQSSPEPELFVPKVLPGKECPSRFHVYSARNSDQDHLQANTGPAQLKISNRLPWEIRRQIRTAVDFEFHEQTRAIWRLVRVDKRIFFFPRSQAICCRPSGATMIV